MSTCRIIIVIILTAGSLSAVHHQNDEQLGHHQPNVQDNNQVQMPGQSGQQLNESYVVPRPRKKIYQRIMPKRPVNYQPNRVEPVQPSRPVIPPPIPPVHNVEVKTYHIGQDDTHDFGYIVQDPVHQNYQGRKEMVAGDVISGTYYLMEADGSLRKVDYIADPVHGFRAIVTDKHGSHLHGFNYNSEYTSAHNVQSN